MKKKHLLAAILIALVLMVLMAAPAWAAPQFSDSAGPYQDAIETLGSWGIVDGYPGGTFKAGDLLMRQQFAKMAVLTLGYPVAGTDVSTFKDTPAIDPANPLYPGSYVAVAAGKGVLKGYTGGAFGFRDNVTRQQIISVVVRAAGAKLAEAPAGWQGIFDYSDPIHGQNIKKAEYNGLLAGISDVYDWDVTAAATRGEAACLLSQLFKCISPLDAGASGAVKVSGRVDMPVGLTVSRLEGLGVVTVTVEHPKNGPTAYTGVRFSTLFEMLALQAGAAEVDAVASDGYLWTINVSDIQATPDAMLAIADGKLNLVMPGMSSKAWVKDIVALTFR